MYIPLSYQDAISSIILVRLHFVSNKFRFFENLLGRVQSSVHYRKENILSLVAIVF